MSGGFPELPAEAWLLEQLPVGVVVFDGERSSYANPAALRILGRGPADDLSITPDIVDPAERDLVWARFRARLKGEAAPGVYEFTVLRGDGTRTRVEYEARRIGPNRVVALFRDLGLRVRDRALLVALGSLAVEVQRARTAPEILARVTDGLRRIGFWSTLLRTGGTTATVVKLSIPTGPLAEVERLLGRPVEGLTIPLARAGEVDRALAEDRPLHLDDATPALARFLARLGLERHPDLTRLCEELTGGKLAIAPLRAGGLAWGALLVAAPSLTEADTAALALFAGQVGASLEVAESLALLARRNRELAAVADLARSAGPAHVDVVEAPPDRLAQAEARRRIHFLSTLWDLGRAGSEARAVGPLVSQVLERLGQALAIDAAAIHAVEDDRLVLAGPRFGNWTPIPEEEMRVVALEGHRLTGAAVLQRRTVIERLLDPDPGSAATRLGSPHAVAVPLLARDRVVGTLTVIRREEPPFSPEEVQLLEICAAQVAVAVEHARLFEQKRSRVRDLSLLNQLSAVLSSQLERPAVLASGVRFLERMFEGANVFLLLPEADGTLAVAASSVEESWVRGLRFPPDRPSAVAEAVRSVRPVLIDDVAADDRAAREVGARFGHHALLAVPLVSRGLPIGALVLGDPRPGRTFSRVEIDRVMPMAAAIAAALVNARLLEDERRRVAELRLLLDVARTITGSLDLERILEVSARTLVEMVGAGTAHILLLDGGSHQLRGAATSSDQHRARIKVTAIPLDRTTASTRCVATRAPVAVEDTAAPGVPVDRELATALGERSVLALPLLVRDEPIGAVVVGDLRGPRRWTEEEIERASLVAHQVAVAVANARLFTDLRRSYAELARTQEELVKRERLAALGELSAVVAHEVRNPLGVIFNAMGPLRRLLQPTGDARMLLDIVGEEADRLNRIVSDLLDFARPHEPSLEKASLPALVDDVLAAIRADPAARQVTFVTVTRAELPQLRIDARMIRQALLNLIQNAVQALPKGGTVHVSVRPDGDDAAVVDVTDSGPGIPPELAAKIFEPFFTTKATGTGLGLAVVKRIVEAHRGEIALATPPGGGTTFTVRLPLRGAR